MKTIDSFL